MLSWTQLYNKDLYIYIHTHYSVYTTKTLVRIYKLFHLNYTKILVIKTIFACLFTSRYFFKLKNSFNLSNFSKIENVYILFVQYFRQNISLEEQHTVSLLIYTKHIPLPLFNFEITSKNDEYPISFSYNY